MELKLDYRDDRFTYDSRPEHLRALLELLRPLHRLQCLELRHLFFDDDFVKELTLHNQEDGHQPDVIMLPSLTDIDIGWHYLREGHLSVDLMEEMLVSRAKFGKGLTGVRIKALGFENFGEASERMRTLVEDGLVVSFGTSKYLFQTAHLSQIRRE